MVLQVEGEEVTLVSNQWMDQTGTPATTCVLIEENGTSSVAINLAHRVWNCHAELSITNCHAELSMTASTSRSY